MVTPLDSSRGFRTLTFAESEIGRRETTWEECHAQESQGTPRSLADSGEIRRVL